MQSSHMNYTTMSVNMSNTLQSFSKSEDVLGGTEGHTVFHTGHTISPLSQMWAVWHTKLLELESGFKMVTATQSTVVDFYTQMYPMPLKH